MNRIIQIIADELNVKEEQVTNTIKLIDDGNTIPFIARYRKEVTGGLSDEILRDLDERLKYLRNLEERKQEVIKSIDGQGKLTDEIVQSLENAKTLSEVEDIYRPYKQKKKTRATIAKAKGLEPLAQIIFEQNNKRNIKEIAKEFIDEEKGEESMCYLSSSIDSQIKILNISKYISYYMDNNNYCFNIEFMLDAFWYWFLILFSMPVR